ncbi:hypothetical protein V6N13_103784 [Hibiscus sabdariffa]
MVYFSRLMDADIEAAVARHAEAAAARNRVLQTLRENNILAANAVAKFKKIQSENETLKESLVEATKEIAELKAALAAKLNVQKN